MDVVEDIKQAIRNVVRMKMLEHDGVSASFKDTAKSITVQIRESSDREPQSKEERVAMEFGEKEALRLADKNAGDAE